ncbi:FadR family transcriptional regulator [Roseibium sp. CAU 1637]|uniref:FadR family transcriptional regulator n=1 Tax=Roseibium limicola TaxID=2816037 RepID=A0A939EN88_9HYPH|nr:FCD domain-containing protein [Roseibium limicola]MBO0344104.1 FadR family transcriptional regulator [Roseibium limicola]
MTVSVGAQDQKARKRLRRPDMLAVQLRERIVEAGLRPGDRIPTDWIQPEEVKVARGTLREALKILEYQGLIKSRSGPGGGVFVDQVNPSEAIRLLDNLFLFSPPSIADIYTMRKQLEPELAASVAGHLSDEGFKSLQACIRLYEDEPKTAEEEYAQRLAELDFHEELARHSPNPLLAFSCTFLLSLLHDMTVCRSIYKEPNPGLRETGLHYQVRLLRSIRAGDVELSRMIMRGHMMEAEKYMLERAALRTNEPDKRHREPAPTT